MAKDLLKKLKAGEEIFFTGLDKNVYSVKYTSDDYHLVNGLKWFKEGKEVNNVALKEAEIINYLDGLIGNKALL